VRTFILGAIVVGASAVAMHAQAPPRPAATTPTPARSASAPSAQTPPARGAAPAPARGTASAPARGAAPVTSTTPTASVASTPTPPAPAYTYQAGGRRDPFKSLLVAVTRGTGSGTAPPLPIVIKELKDILVSDVTVKGVLQNGNTYLAMVQGPNGKTYVAHVGDSLRNGTIRSITPQGMVIVQNINDPLTTQSQREVRKLLRSFEEAK